MEGSTQPRHTVTCRKANLDIAQSHHVDNGECVNVLEWMLDPYLCVQTTHDMHSGADSKDEDTFPERQ